MVMPFKQWAIPNLSLSEWRVKSAFQSRLWNALLRIWTTALRVGLVVVPARGVTARLAVRVSGTWNPQKTVMEGA
jgi:hypothetical protein